MKEVIRQTKRNPDSDTAPRFLLVGKNGPIAEFETWEDASQYRNDLQHHGATIVGVEKKPLEPGAVQELAANQQPNAPANQQPEPSVNQQSNPPVALQSNPTAAQQSNPPANQRLNAPANQQQGQPVNQQPDPPATRQSNPTGAQQSNQPVAQPANPPAMIAGGLNSPNDRAVQEVKIADAPRGSRPNSLPQAGALPTNSTVMRIVGKIFPLAARTATLNACPQVLTNRYELLVLGNCDAPITNEDGLGNLTLTCAPTAPQCGTINIQYTSD